MTVLETVLVTALAVELDIKVGRLVWIVYPFALVVTGCGALALRMVDVTMGIEDGNSGPTADKVWRRVLVGNVTSGDSVKGSL